MKKLSFENKVVVVTGSSGGIGKAIAQSFCEQGARVMLNGRNAEKLNKTRELLIGQGFEVAALVADVTNTDSCNQLIQNTIDKFGKIDILVANASMPMRGRFDEMDPAKFKSLFDGVFDSVLIPAYSVLDALKSSRGSFVVIGSIAGLYGLPNNSPYSSGKMALTALVQSLQAELHDSGIHVGMVYVGFTQNDPDKRIMAQDGALIPVPKRPSLIEQRQESIGKAVVRFTRRRKNKVTLSWVGKLASFLFRFFPSFVGWSLIRLQNRIRKM